MNVLNFKLDGNKLQRVSGFSPAAGGVNADECRFAFDGDWGTQINKSEITAVFWRDSSLPYYQAVIDGRCEIPPAVLGGDGVVNLALIAGEYTSGKLEQFADEQAEVTTSTIVKFCVQPSAVSALDYTEQPTLGLYAHLLVIAEEAKERADEVINAAGDALSGAQSAAEQASNSNREAGASAESAAQSEVRATSAASSALQSKNSAETAAGEAADSANTASLKAEDAFAARQTAISKAKEATDIVETVTEFTNVAAVEEYVNANKLVKPNMTDFLNNTDSPEYTVKSSTKGYITSSGAAVPDTSSPAYYSELIPVLQNSNYFITADSGYIDVADVNYQPVALYDSSGNFQSRLSLSELSEITSQKKYSFNSGSASQIRLLVQSDNLINISLQKAAGANDIYTLKSNIKVGKDNIQSGAVTGSTIENRTITSENIANHAVTALEIADYTITDGKLAPELLLDIFAKGPYVKKSGEYVECCPSDKSQVEFCINGKTTQEGEGEPNPDGNIRPISGAGGSFDLIAAGCGIAIGSTIDTPGELYGANGVCDTFEPLVIIDGEEKSRLTRRFGKLVLDGTEEWEAANTGSPSTADRYSCKTGLTNITDVQICSNFKYKALATEKDGFCLASTAPVGTLYINFPYGDAQELKNYLGLLYDAGQPVTIIYQLAKPEITLGEPQLYMQTAEQADKYEPEKLLVYAEGQDVTVRYNQDLSYTYNELKDAITALRGEING